MTQSGHDGFAPALDNLPGIEEGKLYDTRLYRCLDRILPHNTSLERHRKERYGDLSGAGFGVLLCDLASTCAEGAAYLLRPNLEASSAADLLTGYMQLTEAEAPFRALKSERSVRPLFHQKEPRVKALALRATLHGAGNVLPATDGREIRLRRITEPGADLKELLRQLGLSLPERFEPNPKGTANFATA